jgi:hypothetical protein
VALNQTRLAVNDACIFLCFSTPCSVTSKSMIKNSLQSFVYKDIGA